MKAWATMTILAAGLTPAMALAETVQSSSLEAEMTRRTVNMTSESGRSITAQQVYVTMRRRDGAQIGAADLDEYVLFAERAACGDGAVLVSIVVGAEDGAGRYEVLCAGGN